MHLYAPELDAPVDLIIYMCKRSVHDAPHNANGRRMSQEKTILIIGAGPTGLGAAWRLNELGYKNWLLLERSETAGGLAGSVTDAKGFTWDMGGHVQFSHYKYFDDLMDTLLGKDGWLEHERESWVWMRERFIPYPFQLNIRHLPHDEMKECVAGLVKLYKQGNHRRPTNFAEWIDATFGEGLGRVFMRPYNYKVWAFPPEMLNNTWVGERVAVTDLERVLGNIFDQKDDISWGPNNTFRFPKHGGTGAVWRACAAKLPQEKLRYGADVVEVNAPKKQLKLSSGDTLEYDHLLSTIPLVQLAERMQKDEVLPCETSGLLHSSTHIFGLGLKGGPRNELAKKCWMYFPEDNCPFYRVTVFSNYSPYNVPDIREYWSLMAEVSESPQKKVAGPEELLEQVIQGALNTRLIESRDEIVDVFQTRLEYGYPTPSVGRDETLFKLLPALDRRGISSRGRFGAWRYEVANQDHSLMQGVEWVNHKLFGSEELTLWHPEIVNNMSRPALKAHT